MKVLTIAAVAWLASAASEPSSGAGRLVDGIAAVVNGEVITISEFDGQCRGMIPEGGREKTDLRLDVMRQMIAEKLIAEEIRKSHVEITEREVDLAVSDIQRRNNLGEEELKAALTAQGMSWDRYRKDIRDQLTRYRLMDLKVKGRVKVSEEDVRGYYIRNYASAGKNVKIKVRLIFIAVPAGATVQVLEEKKTLAEDIVGRAKKGEDFAQLAGKYSEDPTTASEGGLSGYLKPSEMLPEVAEAALLLSVGQTSGVIKTTPGFCVIRLEDRQGVEAEPFEKVKDEITSGLYQEAVEREFKMWVEELRKEAYVDVKVGGLEALSSKKEEQEEP